MPQLVRRSLARVNGRDRDVQALRDRARRLVPNQRRARRRGTAAEARAGVDDGAARLRVRRARRSQGRRAVGRPGLAVRGLRVAAPHARAGATGSASRAAATPAGCRRERAGYSAITTGVLREVVGVVRIGDGLCAGCQRLSPAAPSGQGWQGCRVTWKCRRCASRPEIRPVSRIGAEPPRGRPGSRVPSVRLTLLAVSAPNALVPGGTSSPPWQ